MDLVIHKGSFVPINKSYVEEYQDVDGSTRVYGGGSGRNKHFVFDLDETIGSFSDLYALWKAIGHHHHHTDISMDQDLFCAFMDLYPECLRYGILTMFEFLNMKKTQGHCGSVFLYTNNQCPSSWTTMIIEYVEKRANVRGLFDQVVHAFKISGKRVEQGRTTHAKTFGDLVKCTVLPKTAEICFIDNTRFPRMIHDRVYYIQPKSYFHALSLAEIVGRFVRSDLGHRMGAMDGVLLDYCLGEGCTMDPVIKSLAECEVDIQVSKKMMYHIKEFFYLALRRPKTRKIRGRFFYRGSKKKR
jgi:hypothetical protein